VFENRALRRIFGPKRNKVTAEWRKLHNGELHNLYSSPDIIRQIKLRRMRWAGKGRGEKRVQGFGGKPRVQGVDGRMGSKWTLGRLVGGYGVDSPGLG
jgi:hypothetical protein